MVRAIEQAHVIHAEPRGLLIQEDTYFQVPHGRLKLREFPDGSSELIAYERPNQQGQRWSNYRRITITTATDLKHALADTLGVACVVKKKRHLFLMPGARIHIDQVEGLGSFLEFEVTTEDASLAPHLMSQLRESFNVADVETIAGSYADLLLNSTPA